MVSKKIKTEGKTRRMQRCNRNERTARQIADNLAEQITACRDLLKVLQVKKRQYDIEAMDWVNLWYDADKAPEDTRWEATDSIK